ncbi:hypothetical protein [Nostocoides sp. HKS02]|uniref:hypothetical protein n=1 Tax=Nostocoides sp. HKS02 TaxID=1813880 RepID=UPI0012B456E0|nr:hypothetical protein [Tetrasphaera sp. HKS02]QGN56764.1 hypothetical protein GKE56_01305 [Tetrasphaera sp. HKS02]
MPAHAKGAITDGEVRSIMARINATGHVSRADRAALLTRPEVAAQIVDPSSGVLKQEPAGASPAGQPRLVAPAYATRSSSADRYIQYSSITGATVLDYHFTIYWTYNGSTVTAQPQRGHYLRTSAPGIYDRGFTNNTAYANLPGPYAYTVTMQATWEQCIIKWGCVASGNPFTQFGVYFDGTYHIVQRQ